MKIPPLLFLLLIFFIQTNQTNSQNPADTESNTPNSPDSVSNFQPSLAVVIGMLAVMFSLTFILLLYAKFCHRAASFQTSYLHQIHDGLPRSRSPVAAAGVDKTVVESLPLLPLLLSLKGSRDGLECAVCLAKFEDVDVLRLLPKCKHAFHIDCIDQWLDKHSTCPLCRRKVGPDDLSQLQCSSSLRFLWNPPPDLRAEDSDLEQLLELHVEREESHRGSNRFCIGSSFRKTTDAAKEDERLPIPPNMDCNSPPPLHRFNHKIIISDAALKNRWSNVSSSDIMFLNSEMLNDVSSERFSEMREKEERRENDHEEMNIKEEMERKRLFESKLREINHQNATSSSSDSNKRKLGFEFESNSNSISSSNSLIVNPNEKRSMSEIVIHPRFKELRDNNIKDSINIKEERIRRLWLPIARKTVQWFANRERRSSHSSQSQEINVRACMTDHRRKSRPVTQQ